jgi:MoxR-like ATPase
MFAEGHLLLEDVPGVGKTSLARAIASTIDASWHRIQFTPDLLPSDVTGVSIWNQGTREFEFHPGPVFANVVLADEINRASPKTQSALLEVMEERQVTVESASRAVPRPFMVIATQNPVDMDGTYRLPEAQLDRFLLRASVGYPSHAAEIEVLDGQQGGRSPLDQVTPVLSIDDVRLMTRVANEVYVAPAVRSYLVTLVAGTRELPEVRLGASPRGSLALMRACRARAAADGRDYVVPEDAKALAAAVLAHRMLLQPQAELQGVTTQQLIDAVVEKVPTPQAAGRA